MLRRFGTRRLALPLALWCLLPTALPAAMRAHDTVVVAAALGLWLLATLYLLTCAARRSRAMLDTLQAQVIALQAGKEDTVVAHGDGELEQAGQLLAVAIERLQRRRDALARAADAVQQGAQTVADEQVALLLRAGEMRGAFAELSRRGLAFTALLDDCGQGVEAGLAEMQAWRDEEHHAAHALSGLRSRLLGLNGLGREIAHVVQNIEVVAQQTRMLALNALVEAEPLGSAAQGFVVVVQELRALAQRNEDAARTLQKVIAAALVEIDAGHQASERAGQAGLDTGRRIDAVQQVLADLAGHAEHGDRDARQLIGLNERMAGDIDALAQHVERLARGLTGLRCQGHALQAAVHAVPAG